jgi:hypothetical protein
MTASNPGPASATNPNSIMANFVQSGTTTLYTFATLPAAANFAVGFMAETSDQGMCHVILVSGVLTWAVLGIPQSGGAIQRYIHPLGGAMTNLTAPGQGSLSLQYVDMQWPVTATRFDAMVAWAAASSAGAETGAVVISAYAGIYSNSGPGTLTMLSSGSTQTTYTYASNSAGVTALISSGIRPISVPMNISMTPGEYIVGFNFSTNSSSIGTATTNLAQTISMMGWGGNQSALNYAEFTAASTSNSGLYGAMGIWSSAGTGLPTTIPVTAIGQTGANQSRAQYAFVMRNY